MSLARLILHVDMDAFYAAIEERDDPTLKNRPLIVGGLNRRGVVATANYVARRYGVGSAMPMSEALRRCPQAEVRAPRMSHYVATSQVIMAVLARFTPLMEPLSLDEAFLDMSGCERLFGSPLEIARQIKAEIARETRLSSSIGIAHNKFLAKLGSDLDKPDAITSIPSSGAASFIAPLPLRKLWGVGPRTAEQLGTLGLKTIGDLACANSEQLARRIGASHARQLVRLARAQDDRPVISERGRKSVGAEVTLDQDIRGAQAVSEVLRGQCRRVAQALRKGGLRSGAVRVKLRYADTFRLASRQATLPQPVDDSQSLFEATSRLLGELALDQPIRLVGAAAFHLSGEGQSMPQQLALFEAEQAKARSELEHTVDRIVNRFGDKISFGGG